MEEGRVAYFLVLASLVFFADVPFAVRGLASEDPGSNFK